MHVRGAAPTHNRVWQAVALVLAATLPTLASAQSLELSGLMAESVVIDAKAIKAMPHRTVTAALHGLSGVYSGVPMTALLARVNAPQGDALRGPAMSDLVVVEACDGYRVVFTLPDIEPAFRDQTAIIADAVDGRALDSHEGPFRLIIEGDKRAARSARCVTRISLQAARQAIAVR